MEQMLDGIRVVELASPCCEYAGKLLADFGADVVVVERPGGSESRRIPPCLKGLENDKEGSLHWQYYNTNKRSVVLDWHSPDDLLRLEGLLRSADVVLEGESFATLSGLGLHPEEWVKKNERTVWASVTAFGRSGPYRDFRAPDVIVFALGGLMFISGTPDGPPVNAPEYQAYKVAGAHTALQVLIALWGRRAGGKGDWLDISAMEALAAQENVVSEFTGPGKIIRRAGSQHIRSVPGRIYPCKDGYVHMMIAGSQLGVWERFLDWFAYADELRDEKWKDATYRRENAEHVDELMRKYTRLHTKTEIYESAQRSHLPCAPVNTMEDFLQDPQIQARGFSAEVTHPSLGRLRLPWGMYKYSESPPRLRSAAPMLGQHTQAVFKEWLNQGARNMNGRDRAMAAPLQGIRVADFSHMVAGPYGTLQLGYFGADVIKIESAVRPDTWRVRDGNTDIEMSRPFSDHNKNKRSLSVNLKHPLGIEIVKRLLAKSDVVVENFSFGVMKRLGLSYESLRAVKPDIIVVSLQGLGQTGPRKEYVTWGPNLLPFSGMTYLWNPSDENEPVGSQTSYPDYVVAVHAAYAIMGALFYREKTGKGQNIDLSQAEITASLLGAAYSDYLNNGVNPSPVGNRSCIHAPHNVYPCRGTDEWCVIAITSTEEWQNFCRLRGWEDWLADESLLDAAGRLARAKELDARIAEWTRTESAFAVMRRLQATGVPAGVVQNGQMLAQSEQLRDRHFLTPVAHPVMGEVVFPTAPVHALRNPPEIKRHAPMLGQDTQAICRDVLGLSEEEIGRYQQAGALT